MYLLRYQITCLNKKEKTNRKKKEGKKEMTVTDDHEGTQIKRFSTITAPK